MRKTLIPALAMALLAACALRPEVASLDIALAGTAAAPAEPQVMPEVRWRSTGDGGYIYHNVWADCSFLLHGNGRNNAWGLWRLPVSAVQHSGIEGDEETGFRVAYTCKDGSACIQSGSLEETPHRVSEHIIPFGSRAHAEAWLDDVLKMTEACAARL